MRLPLPSLLLFLLIFLGCASDDDICISGEATPRIKIKFKEQGKELQLSRLILGVDYGSGEKIIIDRQRVDSVLVPLRVDDAAYTDLFIRTSEDGPKSQVRIQYTGETSYVSPACGVKKIYKEVASSLVESDPVQGVEQTQTEINDELPTHLYLIF